MSVKANALAQAIKILNALKVGYAIIDEDGNRHGNLEVTEPKKRAPSAFPRGEVRSYVLQFIEKIQVGEIKEVPADKYGLERVRANCCSWLIERYGPGCCTTSINHDNNTIEILRIS